MARKILPVDIHPDLTRSRLEAIAELLQSVRDKVINKREINCGDDAWSVGCRAYSWTRSAISEAASTDPKFIPWLKVLEDKGLYFTFTIGAIPIKFYRGSPDHLPNKTSYFKAQEFLARQYAFPSMKEENSFVFRFIIETDSSLKIKTVTLVQIGIGGSIINSWPIQLAKVTNFASLKNHGIKLPKPYVRVKQPKGNKIGKFTDE